MNNIGEELYLVKLSSGDVLVAGGGIWGNLGKGVTMSH